MQLTFRIDHSTRSAVSADPRFLVAGDLYDPLVLDFSECPRGLVDEVDVGSLRLELRRDSAAGEVVASVPVFTRVPSRRFLCSGVLSFATAELLAWWGEVSAKMLAGTAETGADSSSTPRTVPRSDATCWMSVCDSKTAYVACTVPVVLCGFSERDSLDVLLDSAEERLDGLVADATAQASAAETAATSASSSATEAKASATSASSSATEAKASATSASSSAAEAKAGATSASSSATAAETSAAEAKAGATSASSSATAAETSAAEAKAGATSASSSADAAASSASTAASLLDTKLDRTYEDNGFTEEHAAGKVTMSSGETAAVTLDASDGGSVTVGSSKLTAPSGKLLSNGSKVALADDVRGKADLAVYDVKGFRLAGMKTTIRVSSVTESWEYGVGTVFTEDERGVDVEVGEFVLSDGVASVQLGSVPLPGENPAMVGAVLKVSGVLTADGVGAYVPVGASATISCTIDYGESYGEYSIEFCSKFAADGSLSPDPSNSYMSYGPYGQLGLYGSVDADPCVEKSTDTLAKSSEKLDTSPHNVGLDLTRDDSVELVLQLTHEKSDESVRISAPSVVGGTGGANIMLSCGQSMASAYLYRTLGLQIRDEDYKESTYAVSASVGGDLKVAGDVRVPSLLLYCEDDGKYHRLKAAKTADGTFALALDQEGVS